MTDFFDLMRDVPPHLAAAWGGWLAAGLALLLWHLRARAWEAEHAQFLQLMARQARAPRPAPREP